MYKFVEKFEEYVEGKDELRDMLAQIVNGENIDLEELMRRLHQLIALLNDETYQRVTDPPQKEQNTLVNLENLKQELMEFVYRKCSDYDERVASNTFKTIIELKDLFSAESLKIFTTNYDTCIEEFFRERELDLTTGFKAKGSYQIWDRAAFKDPSYQVYLYKLHGSITWYKYNEEIVQMPPVGPTLPSPQGEKFEVKMIYPISGKEVFESPYSELQYYLRKTLEDACVCVVIGYSFRDASINSIFQNAFNENENLRVVVVNPKAEKVAANLGREVEKIPERIQDFQLLQEDGEMRDELTPLLEDVAKKLKDKAFGFRDKEPEYEKGVEVGKRAIELALKVDKFETAAFASAAVKSCYDNLEDNSNAEKYAEKQIEYYKKVDEKTGSALYNLGLAHKKLGNKEQASRFFEYATNKFREEDKPEKVEQAKYMKEKLSLK